MSSVLSGKVLCRSCSFGHSKLDEVEDVSTDTEAAAPGMGKVGQVELHDGAKEQVGLHVGKDLGQHGLLAAAEGGDIQTELQAVVEGDDTQTEPHADVDGDDTRCAAEVDDNRVAVAEDDTQNEPQAVAEEDGVQAAAAEGGIQTGMEADETAGALCWAAEHAE